MSGDFYTNSILPYAGIIIKICRAYSNSQEDFEDYYQEVCLQIWRSKDNFNGNSEWSTWIYRLSLNVCMTLRKRENNRNLQILKSSELPEIANQELFSFQDKYLEEHCDDSYDLIQYDSIWNTIARVIENIAIDNQ